MLSAKIMRRVFYVVCGSLLLTGLESAIFRQHPTARGGYKFYPVLVARRNLQGDEVISDDNTRVRYMSVGESQNIFLLNSQWSQVKGLKTNQKIPQDTPLLSLFFDKNTLQKSATQKIPSGKRLYELDLNLGNLGYFLKVHDTIDVIGEIALPDKPKVTLTLLSGVNVIGIGDHFDGENHGENSDTSLSFYLTPQEIQVLSLIKPYTNFSISIRNPNEENHSKNSSTSLETLLKNPIFNQVPKE